MLTKGKSILVVEDDHKIRELVRIYLEKEGYEVYEASDGEEAIDLFKSVDPCFVILDLMLPNMSGEEVCQKIRGEFKAQAPIIMLTAKVAEVDRIKGLKMGADDYVTKPFSPAELIARVESVLRRTGHRCGKITYRGLTVKPIRGEAHFRGESLLLTQHEFKLLYFLMRHPNHILSREQMIDELYPQQEKIVSERTIDVHVANLREKLTKFEQQEWIETVRGMGYRFVAY
ncbi:DNA-binding response regulator [Ammoniphilus oxalaticus]|uniref:DNA-binding response regulator n=1 Tax=Ammoniphilus oxalaticus TaxID=66863 RepID=A0A419SLP8_9BACL|nr:response regulator transcription factor [Ammoniphilus oxalaticus]RKD25000.1 DNA-binding response regulator [Ammoniphilus oxalaticus]